MACPANHCNHQGVLQRLPLRRRCRRLRDHETGSTCILADILSDIPSGVLADIFSDIPSGILSVQSDIFSDILSGIPFDIFGILSGTYS